MNLLLNEFNSQKEFSLIFRLLLILVSFVFINIFSCLVWSNIEFELKDRSSLRMQSNNEANNGKISFQVWQGSAL